MIKITFIAITTFQEKTWGRVYVQYEKDGKHFYAFKNWFEKEEKRYFSEGRLESEPAFSWFNPENRHYFYSAEEVLNGTADNLYLTPEKHKKEYGTPSVILRRLLVEIRANNLERVDGRRSWFHKQQELIISPIVLDVRTRSIRFPLYAEEIKFEPRQFLVYLFYLRHPEGIVRKNIPDFLEELSSLYGKITVSTDKEKIEKVLSGLTDLSKNTWDEQISKIKKQLTDTLGERIAKVYLIQGARENSYTIPLSQELISIEEF